MGHVADSCCRSYRTTTDHEAKRRTSLPRTENDPRRQQLSRRGTADRSPDRAQLRLHRVRWIDTCHRSDPAGYVLWRRAWIGGAFERRRRVGSVGLSLIGGRLIQILKMLFDRGRWSGRKARQQSRRCAAGTDKLLAKRGTQLRGREWMVNPPYSPIGIRFIEITVPRY